MSQARQASARRAQAHGLVAGIRQSHSVTKTAVVMMILRAVLVMIRITGMPVTVMMMLRVTVHGGDHLTGIRRERTRLKPGADTEKQQPCKNPAHHERAED